MQFAEQRPVSFIVVQISSNQKGCSHFADSEGASVGETQRDNARLAEVSQCFAPAVAHRLGRRCRRWSDRD